MLYNDTVYINKTCYLNLSLVTQNCFTDRSRKILFYLKYAVEHLKHWGTLQMLCTQLTFGHSAYSATEKGKMQCNLLTWIHFVQILLHIWMGSYILFKFYGLIIFVATDNYNGVFIIFILQNIFIIDKISLFLLL